MTKRLYQGLFEYEGEFDYVNFVADKGASYDDLKRIASDIVYEFDEDKNKDFKENYADTMQVYAIDEVDGYKINLTK